MQLPYTPADSPVNPHTLEIPSKSPWQVIPGQSQRTMTILDAEDHYIAVVVGDQAAANARLLVAAPELEEACRYCLDMLLQQVQTCDKQRLETIADRLTGIGGARARFLLEAALDKVKGLQS